jgi:hypothetical protein
LDYNKDSQNIAASFMNGTAELALFITQKGLAARKFLEPGIMNVENQPLVDPSKILPSIHSNNSNPLQAWGGPDGARKIRFPDYMTMVQDGGKFVTLTYRLPLPQEMLLVLISLIV